MSVSVENRRFGFRRGQSESKEKFWDKTENGWKKAGILRSRGDYIKVVNVDPQTELATFRSPQDSRQALALMNDTVNHLKDHPQNGVNPSTEKTSVRCDEERDVHGIKTVFLHGFDFAEDGQVVDREIIWKVKERPLRRRQVSVRAYEHHTDTNSWNHFKIREITIAEITALQKRIIEPLLSPAVRS